jgi:nucleoside-diphosphate-sugar epimerase
MNILFIGGTGNLSAVCADLLYRQGHAIFVMNRGRVPVPDHYTALTADRNDIEQVHRCTEGIKLDAVLNFLGYTPKDLAIDFEVFAGRIQHYIFISSATVYAKPHRSLPITEKTPLGNPFSEYARNKQACEEWLSERLTHDQFPMTVIRPSHTYSCRWIPNIVNSSTWTPVFRLENHLPLFIHDDGQSLWTLTAAGDFAVGVAGLVGREWAIGESYHITSDQVLTWNQIYEEICRAGHFRDPNIMHIPLEFICNIVPDMTAKLKGDKAEPGVFDNAKIKKAVAEFECHTTFRQGMEQAMAWFRQDSQRRQVDAGVNALFDQVTEAWAQTL